MNTTGIKARLALESPCVRAIRRLRAAETVPAAVEAAPSMPRFRLTAPLGALFSLMTTSAIALMLAAAVWLAEHRAHVPSHWDPFAPLVLSAPSTPVQTWKIARARAEPAACRAALAAAGVAFTPRDDEAESDTCSKRAAVRLSRLAGAELEALDTRCAVALGLALWEARSVQPAAREELGVDVTEMLHFGSYSCRKIAGTSWWSQHASANAVDISGFRLADGRVVSLRKDWRGAGPEARFLRRVRDGACEAFSAVLSPDFDAAHHDHFHFDNGFWRACR